MNKITKVGLAVIALAAYSFQLNAQCETYSYFTDNSGWGSSNEYLLFDLNVEKLPSAGYPLTGAESGRYDNAIWGSPLVYRKPYGSGVIQTPIYTWDDDKEDFVQTSKNYPITYFNCVFAPNHETSAFDKYENYGEEPSGKNDPCTKNDGTVLANGMYTKKGFIELSRDESPETEASRHGYIQIDGLRRVERIQWSYSSTSWKRGVKCDIKIGDGEWQRQRWVASDQNNYAVFSEQGYKFDEVLKRKNDDTPISIRFRIWDGDTISFAPLQEGETKPAGYYRVKQNPHGMMQVVRIHQIKVWSYLDGAEHGAPVGFASTEAENLTIRKEDAEIVLSQPAQVEIYSIEGKLIKNQRGERINISGLNKGLYVVKARVSDGSVKNIKIAL